MNWQEIVNLILNSGVSVVMLGYFIYMNTHLMREIRNLMSRLNTHMDDLFGKEKRGKKHE